MLMYVCTQRNDLCIPALQADGVVLRIMSFEDESEPGQAIEITAYKDSPAPA